MRLSPSKNEIMSEDVSCMRPFDVETTYNKEENGPVPENDPCRLYPGQCILPPFYFDVAEKVRKTSVREDDVWLVSYPRTGSTWCQEMIWLLKNNLDFETAGSTLQQLRAPLLESRLALVEYVDSIKTPSNPIPLPRYRKIRLPLDELPNQLDEVKLKLSSLFSDSVKYAEEMPSPRCIKSHFPFELLPEETMIVKPKIIYTMRNPKDVCVSYYFHCDMLHKMKVDFEIFCEWFLNDALPFGSLFNHYLGFWNRRNDPNILILRYEEMTADTRGTVKKIGQFIGKPLSDEDVDAVCEFLSFQNMRENKACNLQVLIDNNRGDDFYKKTGTHFFRKGIVGDHKNYMSQEMTVRFDRWIEENTKGTDLKF